MSKHLFRLAASSVLMAGLVDAHAGLSLRPPQNFPGSGLGAANVILTLQNIPGFSFEAGSVGRAVGIPGDVISGDVQAGASRTRTRSLRDLGIASAADLRVVFAPLEPAGGADEGISLNNLQLSIFSPSGTLLFNSGFFSPVSFADTVTGGGDSGFVFALDGAQVGEAQAAAFGSGFAGNLVGLSAAASDATGSFETFYVASATAVAAVPEPGTYALILAGALGVAGRLRRRRPA